MTVAPVAHERVNHGRASLVILSVLNVPRSDIAFRSGTPGAGLGAGFIMTEMVGELADSFPAASTSLARYVYDHATDGSGRVSVARLLTQSAWTACVVARA